MADKKRCETCTEECPQAKRAHEAAAGRMFATKEFIALQKKVESGELVEVVRCEDCKYFYHAISSVKDGKCWQFVAYTGADPDVYYDDFCAYGEKHGAEEEA